MQPVEKWEAEKQAIGPSKDELSTKIYAKCDALGDPTDFYLTNGQACDLEGADLFLVDFQTEALLADKAVNADKQVLDKLAEKGSEAVIPPKGKGKNFGNMTGRFTRQGI